MHTVLSQHPDIYMSRVKEPSFFVLYGQAPKTERLDTAFFRKNTVESWEEYETLFTDAAGYKAIGEASTAYLRTPAAPIRIRRHVPEARVIAILRDPAERAFSNYAFYRTIGIERKKSFSQALGSPPHWRHGNDAFGQRYIDLGFYAKAVQRYYETFGRGRVRIYLYEDWTERPLEVLQDIFRYLEVDESFVPDISRRVNESSIPRSRLLARALNPLWPRGGGGLVLPAIGRVLHACNRHPMRLGRDQRHMLIQVYRQDILELQELLGRNLSAWLRS
jgi:hypothetical protein